MCICTPHMRTPCCGSDECHRGLESCVWHTVHKPPPKPDITQDPAYQDGYRAGRIAALEGTTAAEKRGAEREREKIVKWLYAYSERAESKDIYDAAELLELRLDERLYQGGDE